METRDIYNPINNKSEQRSRNVERICWWEDLNSTLLKLWRKLVDCKNEEKTETCSRSDKTNIANMSEENLLLRL